MSEVCREVIDRAVEAGAKARRKEDVRVTDCGLPEWDQLWDSQRNGYLRESRQVVEEAAPVLWDAGYRAGLEKARELFNGMCDIGEALELEAILISEVRNAFAALEHGREERD